MRNDYLKGMMSSETFMMTSSVMESLASFANGESIVAPHVVSADDSVRMQIMGNIGIIAIEGAMHKKGMSGMCMSVVSYPEIISAIKTMEANESIDTVVYVVDTPGGVVASGADEASDLILNSKKKTITLYQNLGASGGMWIFTASDEVYATKLALLGSIGVIAAYKEEDTESKEKTIKVVSKNAENKDCNLSGDCKLKLKTRLDKIEDEFYLRLEKNTGFDKEYFIENFNSGDFIDADKAKEIGFIKDITTIDTLLETLVVGAVPAETKPANKINTKVDVMADEQNVVTAEEAIATERARTAGISALGSQYGISAEAVQAAITDGTEMAAFKDVVIDTQSNQITDLQTKLDESIKSASNSEGEATVEVEARSEAETEKTTAVVVAASKLKV